MARKGTFTATFMFEGRRYYCYGRTQREADTKAIKRLTLLEADVRESNSRITVSEWAKKWLRDYKAGAVGDAWYKAIEGIVRNYIEPCIGDMLIRDVTASDIQRMMNSVSHLSSSHQKKISQITAQIFLSAEENDVIVKLPVRRIKTAPKTHKTASRTLTDEERSLALRTADRYPEDGLFFLIMLFCGLRPGEVSRLQMSDYDRMSRILYVRRARKADGSTGRPKSECGTRSVPVPLYLAERLDKISKKPNEYIVTSAEGRPLTKTTQRRMWQRFRRKMDIENGAEVFRGGIVRSTLADDLRPYLFRHTYCTDLQDAGIPVTVARELMGHSDIKITAEIYTHHSQKSHEDAREKLDLYHKCTTSNTPKDPQRPPLRVRKKALKNARNRCNSKHFQGGGA